MQGYGPVRSEGSHGTKLSQTSRGTVPPSIGPNELQQNCPTALTMLSVSSGEQVEESQKPERYVLGKSKGGGGGKGGIEPHFIKTFGASFPA